MKLVLATQNKNKIIEIDNKLADIEGLSLTPLIEYPDAPSVQEDGVTFKENARKKAEEIARFTGLPVMADDSGLVVDALEGRPGIYSARYGGEGKNDTDRNLLLIQEMEGFALDKRTARFVCVIAIAIPGEETRFTEGSCEGLILEMMRGKKGFGYDPVFYLPYLGKTMAELPLKEKNRISHRARALEKARKTLLSITEKQ